MCAVSSSLGIADREIAGGKLRTRHQTATSSTRPRVIPASVVSPAPPPAPFVFATLDELDGAPVVVEGRAADHPAVQCFLGEAFHGGQRDAFVASLEDPFYEPRDRVLVKRGTRILGHAAITHRVLALRDRQVPAAELRRVATAPELRGQGLSRHLLAAAETRMIEDGAELALLHTRIPHFFHRFGYAVCGRASAWQVNAQQTLAAMPDAAWRSDGHARLTTRPWRQIELPALMRIYRQSTAGVPGVIERTEAYWRWLISRQQYDRIYVAIAGRDRCELQRDEADAVQSPIVGYAVLREDTVLELFTLPGRHAAAEQLLARAAAETLELDRQVVTLHLPPGHPLQAALRRAGAAHHHQECWQGAVTMVKLLAPDRSLQGLRGELHDRARAASLETPWALSLSVDRTTYTLVGGRRGVKAQAGALPGGRKKISLNHADFTRLVLGHLDLHAAHAAGRLRATSGKALELAAALFPQQAPWFPHWDGLGL